MTTDHPFLYELFMALHADSRWPRPGMDEYFLLLQLLERHPQLAATFDEMAFACETLWAKSPAQQQFFREVFRTRRNDLETWLAAAQRHDDKKTSASQKDEASQSTNTGGSTPPHSPTGQKTMAENAPPSPPPGTRPPATPPSTTTQKKEEQEYIEMSVGHGEPAGSGRYMPIPENGGTLPLSKRFFLGKEYFPVSSRVLQQDWRNLVSRQEYAGPSEPDMPRTVRRIATEGFFLDFEYQPRSSNRLALFIFIDRGPGMEAFLPFGVELAQSAVASLAHLYCYPWFFSELPLRDDNPDNGYLLTNQQRTRGTNTFSLFRPVIQQNRVVLIYSDAAAIRGHQPGVEEWQRTENFIGYLLQQTAYVAWMNPAPSHRWKDTKAARIAEQFPEIGMYEATRTGLGQVIDSLKGKTAFKTHRNQ